MLELRCRFDPLLPGRTTPINYTDEKSAKVGAFKRVHGCGSQRTTEKSVQWRPWGAKLFGSVTDESVPPDMVDVAYIYI